MAYLEKLGMAKAHVEDYERRKGHGETFPAPLSDEMYGDNWIARNGLALLGAAPEGKPWFLQVNFNGPHDPWDITASMVKRWRGVKFPPPARSRGMDAATHELVRQNYAAMIENIDRRCGELIEKVRARGELANTLIVFRAITGRCWAIMICRASGIRIMGRPGLHWWRGGVDARKGITVRDPATTLDLTATFVDYAGARAREGMDSRSLRPLLTGKKTSGREYAFSGLEGRRTGGTSMCAGGDRRRWCTICGTIQESWRTWRGGGLTWRRSWRRSWMAKVDSALPRMCGNSGGDFLVILGPWALTLVCAGGRYGRGDERPGAVCLFRAE
jgi:hypothetical protein